MGDEYDITVKGRFVRAHHTLTLSPQAAGALHGVLSAFRNATRTPGFFGLTEVEDEALVQLVDALEPEEGVTADR